MPPEIALRALPSANTDGGTTVLIIEADESLAATLESALREEGYRVLVASDGEAGLALARRDEVDLVILDELPPRLDGFALLRVLSGEQIQVPVMLLRARCAEMDKVTGLQLGAEDYVTRPFELADVRARVKAMLRRDAKARFYRAQSKAGEVHVNAWTRQVRRHGQLVQLTAAEFNVLLCLFGGRGRVLSRGQIQSEVWGQIHQRMPRRIDNVILQLRAKIEEEPSAPTHIVKVRGVGYRFIA